MPIQFTYDPELKILLTVAEGVVSFAEIQKHLDDETAARALGYPELFDATAASTSLTPGEVNQIVGRLQIMCNVPFGPTAFVTVNDTFFGMARMIAILCELRGGPKVAVFRTRDESLAWLALESS
jgi:hypothetical protein